MEIIFAIIIFGVLLLAIAAYIRTVFKKYREDKACEALFYLKKAESEESDPGEKLLQQAIHSHNQQRFDEAAIMIIRGGFGEPYCSQECHDNGGKYAAAVMLKNQTGVCSICQKPVQASMYGTSNCAIVPYEGVNLFICNSCTAQGEAYLRDYRKCCMCQKSI